MTTMDEIEKPVSSGKVAKMFAVDIRTVNRWAKAKKIPAFKTAGGHFRFYRSEIAKFIEQTRQPAQ